MEKEEWMKRAIALAVENARSGLGGPFAALVVKDNRIVATGINAVTSSNDPTAHAEMLAIRAACRRLESFQLHGCEIYTSCEPCPMCLGAIYWARPAAYYFACSRECASQAGFDDGFIYRELTVPAASRSIPGYSLLPESGMEPFVEWSRNPNKAGY
ncbi:MAG: nucleoside deaminase [Acidobacteriaceae bacterium]|nr:nucleoside deaminase [Acidobacteriaceae bacterium]